MVVEACRAFGSLAWASAGFTNPPATLITWLYCGSRYYGSGYNTGPSLILGASTQYLRTLVPKTRPLVVFGSRDLKYWVLGPSGLEMILDWRLLGCQRAPGSPQTRGQSAKMMLPGPEVVDYQGL